jgi:hypothetical protein
VPSGIAPPPIQSLRQSDAKTLNQSTFSQIKFRSAAAVEDQFQGDRSLCSGTLPGPGISPGDISIDSTAISIAVAVSHDEEGVVLPGAEGSTGSYVVHLSPMM